MKEKQRALIIEIMKADEQSGLYTTRKQTAMQLLKESIDYEMKLGTKMVVNWDMYLEMEKEQIIIARQDGLDNGFSNGSWDSNLYYKETYE